MIENGIARFNIAQKIDKRNLIRLRTRKRAHDEIEISRSKPRPTIRSDHRDLIVRERRAYGKSDYKGGQGTQASCSPKDESVPCADLCGTRASSLHDLKPPYRWAGFVATGLPVVPGSCLGFSVAMSLICLVIATAWNVSALESCFRSSWIFAALSSPITISTFR